MDRVANRLLRTAAVVATLVTAMARAEPVARNARMATLAEIDRACDKARDFAGANATSGFTFWDAAAGLIPAAGGGLWWHIEDAERWAIVDSDLLGPHGPNAQVTVWKTSEDVPFVSAFFTSDSGDWAYFVEYCSGQMERWLGPSARSTRSS